AVHVNMSTTSVGCASSAIVLVALGMPILLAAARSWRRAGPSAPGRKTRWLPARSIPLPIRLRELGDEVVEAALETIDHLLPDLRASAQGDPEHHVRREALGL